jgi:D-beta-D-heptose 7-phosphate kinase/D-beta-D-heptose 1-phosphate adenosyltransferase
MSTWDYSLEPIERQRFIHDWMDEQYADETFIKKMLPGVQLKIHNTKDKPYTDNHDTNRMVFHWKVLYDMISKSGTEYDCIFMVRTDSKFYIKTPIFFKTTKKSTLYVSAIATNGVGDIFFFGYGDTIPEFLKNYPDKINDPHMELQEYLDKNYKYPYVDINNLQSSGVIGAHFELIRSNMVGPFHFYKSEESQKDLTGPNPFLLQTNFNEELRRLAIMYHPGPALWLVIGESCKDEFVYGDIKRLAPESPVPVFQPKKTIQTDGMAGNVVNQLEEFMIIPDKFITNDNLIIKRRFVDESSNYMIMRCDEGDDSVQRYDINNLPDSVFDFIIISDYDKGFLTEKDIEHLVNYYKEKVDSINKSDNLNRDTIIFMDTKKQLGNWARNIDFIKLNYKEYLNNKEFIEKNSWLNEKLIITRGEHGSDYNGENFRTNKVNVKDVSGAGDTFLASLAAKFMHCRDILTSIEYANLVSELVVQKRGVETVKPHEIFEHQNKIKCLKDNHLI